MSRKWKAGICPIRLFPKYCPNLYVLAPANYIIELATDSNVILDPGWHDFVLLLQS